MENLVSAAKRNATITWLGWIVCLWLGWRVLLALVGGVADYFLPYAPSFPYYESLLPESNLPRWMYSWANFDGVHYLTIAKVGYKEIGLIQAFFPVYPLLIKALMAIGVPALLAGLMMSNLLALVFIVLWYGYVSDVFDRRLAWISTLIFLAFPTSLFLGALYTESLFLVLVVGSFWAAHRRHWWLAAGLAAIASATRVVGIFLVPALMVELWQQDHERIKWHVMWWVGSVVEVVQRHWRTLLILSASSIGLFAYMFFLWKEFHDPLYFLHVQSEFGAGREERMIIYPQVVWRYIKILVTYRPIDLKYLIYVQEAVVGVLGFVGLLVSLTKVRWSLIVFSLGAFIVPTLTGTFSSMPRYVLVCLPLFLLLAQLLQNRPRWLILYLVGSLILLLVNTLLFVQGYWVA